MVSVLHTNLVSRRVGFVLSCFYKSNFNLVVLFSWRERYNRFFYLALTLTLIPAWRIEILVFLLATERNQIRSVNFDPLLLETRGVFFLESISWNFSTFFSGRVRRLFSARSEFPYTPSINWSGYMRSFLGAQCWAFCSTSCRGAIDNALNLHHRPRVRLPRWETFFFFFLVVLFLFS